MKQFYKCTRCGCIVELDLEKTDGYVLLCREDSTTEGEYSTDIEWEAEICGGRLECVGYNAVSKGEDDDSFHSQ